MFKSILSGLLLSTTVFATIPLETQTLDKVVALVNDNVITSSELNSYVEQQLQYMLAKKIPIPSKRALLKEGLQHLIDIDLELQLARLHGITTDDTELDDAISKIAANNKLSLPQLREAIKHEGLSWKTYRDNLRREIIITRLQQQAIGKDLIISESEINDSSKNLSFLKNMPFTYTLQNLIIPLTENPSFDELKKAQETSMILKNKLTKNTDLGRFALQESTDAQILEGGDIGTFPLKDWPDIFAREVATMQVGDIRGPLRTGNGLQFIKLIAIDIKNGDKTIIKDLEQYKRQQVTTFLQKKKLAAAIENWQQQMRSGAYIKVLDDALI